MLGKVVPQISLKKQNEKKTTAEASMDSATINEKHLNIKTLKPRSAYNHKHKFHRKMVDGRPN